jgi:hypothetical protein
MNGFFGLLGCLLTSFLIVFLMIGRFIYKAYRYYFKPRGNNGNHTGNNNSYTGRNGNFDPNQYGRTRGKTTESNKNDTTNTDTTGQNVNNKKIFAPDEGEYVDFEEES